MKTKEKILIFRRTIAVVTLWVFCFSNVSFAFRCEPQKVFSLRAQAFGERKEKPTSKDPAGAPTAAAPRPEATRELELQMRADLGEIRNLRNELETLKQTRAAAKSDRARRETLNRQIGQRGLQLRRLIFPYMHRQDRCLDDIIGIVYWAMQEYIPSMAQHLIGWADAMRFFSIQTELSSPLAAIYKDQIVFINGLHIDNQIHYILLDRALGNITQQEAKVKLAARLQELGEAATTSEALIQAQELLTQAKQKQAWGGPVGGFNPGDTVKLQRLLYSYCGLEERGDARLSPPRDLRATKETVDRIFEDAGYSCYLFEIPLETLRMMLESTPNIHPLEANAVAYTIRHNIAGDDALSFVMGYLVARGVYDGYDTASRRAQYLIARLQITPDPLDAALDRHAEMTALLGAI